MSLSIRPAVFLALALLGACSRSDPSLDKPVEIDLSDGDPEVASLLRSLIEDAKQEPRAAAARGRLGMAYEANGFLESALACYEQATRLDPAAPRWWYHGAVALFRLAKPDQALARIDSTLARKEEYVPAHRWRADWLRIRGKLAEAERSFRRVAELDPDHPAGPLGLARVLRQAGRAEEAEALLLDSITRHPDSPFVPYLRRELGLVFREMGRAEEAEAQLAQGNTRPPWWTDPWHDEIDAYDVLLNRKHQEATALLAESRPGDAVDILEGLRMTHPTSGEVLRRLGTGYLDLGRLEQARAVLAICVAHHPGDAAAHHRLGQALEKLGRREEAMSSYEEAVRREPNLDHLLAAGALAGKLRRFDEAAAFLDSAIALEPTNPSVLSARETLERRRRR